MRNWGDEFDLHIDEVIKKAGQMIIGTQTEEGVTMIYTVGLAEADLPEVVCFGLPTTHAGMLNEVADLLRKGELPLDTPINGISTNLALVFKAVQPERGIGYVNYANARAGRPVNLIQLVWPDKKGQYPWSKKFNKKMRQSQPCLFEATN